MGSVEQGGDRARADGAALFPAQALSIVLPNVSTLVTTDFTAAPRPMSSTGSPVRTWPRSIAPVTTVPRSARTFVMAAVRHPPRRVK